MGQHLPLTIVSSTLVPVEVGAAQGFGYLAGGHPPPEGIVAHGSRLSQANNSVKQVFALLPHVNTNSNSFLVPQSKRFPETSQGSQMLLVTKHDGCYLLSVLKQHQKYTDQRRRSQVRQVW